MQQSKYSKQINQIYWIGEKGSLEEKIALLLSKCQFISILSGKFRREKSIISIIRNIYDIFRFIMGIFQSIYYIGKYKIDIIFCKGGYVAMPFCVAGKLLGKKIYVHESDIVPGMTNKIVAKFSQKNFTGFPEVLPQCIHVGQILNEEITMFNSQEMNLSEFNLNKTNILVIGGSQGSQFILESLISNFNNIELINNFNFFIILGTKNTGFQQILAKYSFVKVFEFLNQKQIGYLYNICDIGITRGGATSLAEQKLFHMKLLIIPLPYTGGNHQYYNALYYQNNYNDILITQDENTSQILRENILKNINYKKGSFQLDNIRKQLNTNKEIILSKIIF